MRRFYLREPIRVYPKVLVLISIVLEYLGCSSGLIGNCGAIVLY